jgi:hypothetical protein
MKIRSNCVIFTDAEVEITGKERNTNVGPHSDIPMLASGQSYVTKPGFKCEHGGYIPASAIEADHAPYCSLCYPYILKRKE